MKKEKTNEDTSYHCVFRILDLVLFFRGSNCLLQIKPAFYNKITWSGLSSNVESSSDILKHLAKGILAFRDHLLFKTKPNKTGTSIKQTWIHFRFGVKTINMVVLLYFISWNLHSGFNCALFSVFHTHTPGSKFKVQGETTYINNIF